MLETLLYTFLLSISPFGEARTGIPFAILNNVHFVWAFAIGAIANTLVFPLFMWLVDTFNQRFWPFRAYKKGVIYLSKRAKKIAGANVQKHGFWGLMIFVMIPLPGTGAYMGTIAANIFKIERKRAFLAISLGVLVSSAFMAVGTYLGQMGLTLL
ncbi:putative membrane protein [Pontibacter aydingkolensis]|uniref:Small multi-drug export protein n=1 Tax=Pontibacter aydingkolensis TaxID=1911536 RepID=A0ABS7CSU6_9BACT|nr:small multi-drug export protein [Pontibacter aydingkolensis]MBW7466911.1 small multi-drug export protein [Pontibacter aydingkolensis]